MGSCHGTTLWVSRTWGAWDVLIPGVEGLGSWGGDNRPAYLIGRLDGGLYSDDLAAVCFDGRGGGDYLDS